MIRNLNMLARFCQLVPRVLIRIALVGLAIAILGCDRTDDEGSRQADIAAIKSFLATAGDAVNKGDVDAEVSRFT